jgi:hypothetical protein
VEDLQHERSGADPEVPALEAPEALEIAVARGEDWWRVRLAGAVLVYERGRGERVLERAEASPRERDWQRFWRTVNRLKLWTWADRFEGEGDGERWRLELSRGSRRLTSSGRSAFPPLASESATPEFLILCAAISKLAGGVDLPFP